MPVTEKTDEQTGPWSPFRHSAFAILWTATVVSNIGTWMNDVGAGWLMATLSPSPLMVALVQAATTLPIFLFALPAGALADIIDRRKLLLAMNVLLGLTAAIFAALVYLEKVDDWTLLFFTFLLGTGTAISAPAWQAIVPKLVPRSDLQPAIALNSMGINVSRAIGPALAGILIASVGIATPFTLNALSFIGIIVALMLWQPEPNPPRKLPPESLLRAMHTGLRYAVRSGPLTATLIRAVAFFLFASAYWAMLPLIAKQLLGGGPTLYGFMLAAIGAGAVGGAVFSPNIKKALGPDRTVVAGTVGTAAVLFIMATLHSPILAVAACALAGASWISVLSSLHVSSQTALPDWVRARGLSVFLTVFFGAMTLGSLLWGQLASMAGLPAALLVAALGALVAALLSWPFKLNQGADLNLAPSMHWPEPLVSGSVDHDRGPVMVTIEYIVDRQDRDAFLGALGRFSVERRRDGAYEWGVFEDVEKPGRWLEYFMVDSWLEHLRQHERVTESDRALQEAVNAFHKDKAPPLVRHLLAPQ